jgi:sulfite reductase beta subunit-like hemoprotein
MADTLADKHLKDFLAAAPQASREEIDAFRELVEQYFLGTITPDEFKAKRLHMGTYGIRGVKDVHMMRLKLPEGVMTPAQLEAVADVAEQFSKHIAHITTRQDIQLYWIPTQEAPLVLAKLAAVGITTREACSNSVRNVTACPYAGISPTELFDVTPHADAVTRHFLRNPASQRLPRKFKIAFEGCPEDHAKTAIHDIGAVAAIKQEGGQPILGFKVYVGGGLGASPMQAILLEPFTPATELLRTCEAAVRVHDRLGDRKNKAQARIKFVVKRLGPDAFRKEVFAERDKLPNYPYKDVAVTQTHEQPPVPAKDIPTAPAVHDTYKRWAFTNVILQKQAGYSSVIIRLRLGDITSSQMRALAKIIRRYCGGFVRTMITQNLLLRWVRNEHLQALFSELHTVQLADTDAERLYDVTSCPGAETCQLGISASRGLARALEQHLRAANLAGPDIDNIRIKVSGCPNSCGQHHIADIGFFGSAKKVGEHLAPHFQLMLGGMTEEAKAVFGQPVTKLPARRIPEAVIDMISRYRQERQSAQETFPQFAARVGVAYWKQAMAPFTTLPEYAQSPEMYRDWGAETEFSLGGMGPGECAA